MFLMWRTGFMDGAISGGDCVGAGWEGCRGFSFFFDIWLMAIAFLLTCLGVWGII